MTKKVHHLKANDLLIDIKKHFYLDERGIIRMEVVYEAKDDERSSVVDSEDMITIKAETNELDLSPKKKVTT